MKTKDSAPIGQHWLVELYGCTPFLLENVGDVREAVVKAAEVAGATIVAENFHQFSPYGVSGVVVIEESHFTIHTWPEHGYAALDLFTCGNGIDSEAAAQSVAAAFHAAKVEVRYIPRGEWHKATVHAR
jgi:S-adenosylmethionine decarboxylase proenzyme